MLSVISHRGKGEHNHFENSKEAIINSFKLNYIDGVEIDIRITKDNKIIVFHDPILDFATNGNGLVKNKTFNQLKKYKMGIYYRISLLDEVLSEMDKLKTNKKIIIDIKQEFSGSDVLISKLIKMLSKYKYINVYICSFNYNIMKKIKDTYKQTITGLIIGFGINKKRMYNHFNFNLVGFNYVDRIDRSKGNFIFPVNSIDELEKIKQQLKSNNISIITDKPYLFKSQVFTT